MNTDSLNKIVTDEAVLKQLSRPTTLEEVEELNLVNRLTAILDKGWCPAVGYAAIQIGIPLRMAIYIPRRISPDASKRPVVLINPQIKSKRFPMPFYKEGCMSRPGVRQTTWRYNEITFLNLENGQMVERKAVGFEAAVIQHEIDHMEGILNYERLQKPTTPGVNDVCHCGSGQKFKRCCR